MSLPPEDGDDDDELDDQAAPEAPTRGSGGSQKGGKPKASGIKAKAKAKHAPAPATAAAGGGSNKQTRTIYTERYNHPTLNHMPDGALVNKPTRSPIDKMFGC